MSVRHRHAGGLVAKCRTIDKCDIFGDGSGVALYRLDGNANDESGIYHGTETDVTYGGGVYDRGAVFNGSSSRIDFSNPIIPSTGGVSISFWLKWNGDADYAYVFDTGGGSATNGMWCIVHDTADTIYWNFKNGTIGTNIVVPYPVEERSVWTHFVVTWDGTTTTNAAKMYKNGVATSGTHSITQTASGQNFKLGYQGVEYFNGLIDQVRVFNRAITATEVATLYAECAPTSTVDNINPFEDSSLKALYQFNGDAADKTGVYNGTATNVTYGTGKFGQCAVFNGNDSAITTAGIINGGQSWTISIWVNPYTDVNQQNAIYSMGSAENNGFFIYRYNRQMSADSFGTTIHNIENFFTENTLQHLVISYSSGSTKIYLDGVLKGTFSYTWNINGAVNSTIGTQTGVARWFNGSIDQLRIFNKALTPMEVASLYNETTPLEEPLAYLVDPFKDGSGKALYRLEGNALDESGNYNGTSGTVTYGNGISYRCAILNGTSNFIGIPYIPYSTLSLSIWVNTTTLSTGNFTDELFVSFRNSPATFALATTTDGYVGFNNWADTAVQLKSLTPIVSQGWCHIVLTISGTSINMYLNGVHQGSLTKTMLSQALGNRFGAMDNNSRYFTGSIDQARIFDRALTQAEVTTLYTEGA